MFVENIKGVSDFLVPTARVVHAIQSYQLLEDME